MYYNLHFPWMTPNLDKLYKIELEGHLHRPAQPCHDEIMKLLIPFVLAASATLARGAPIPPAAEQIALALHAAPTDRRDGAGVLGYNGAGKLVTLREGKNDLLCLGDNPNKAGIDIACYHKDLEPFMARGRELDADGSKGLDRHKMRWKEVDEGRVKMPREPRMLYVTTGKSYDAAANTIEGSFTRWVVYTPYATAESTGLATKASGSAPWLMYAGTAGAHIMMTPAKPGAPAAAGAHKH